MSDRLPVVISEVLGGGFRAEVEGDPIMCGEGK